MQVIGDTDQNSIVGMVGMEARLNSEVEVKR